MLQYKKTPEQLFVAIRVAFMFGRSQTSNILTWIVVAASTVWMFLCSRSWKDCRDAEGQGNAEKSRSTVWFSLQENFGEELVVHHDTDLKPAEGN